MKIGDFAAFLPTFAETYIMLMNSNAFQGSAGAGNAEFMTIPQCLVDFMEMTKNGVNFKKMGGVLTFCSPGGLRTYRICNVFVWFGVGATRMTENHIFTKIHPFQWNFIEIDEIGGFS